MEIVPTTSNYIIEKVIVNLSFFPQDDVNQEIISQETTPTAQIVDGVAQFTWYNPQESTLKFKAITYIKTTNKPIQIKTKVPFPLIIEERLIPYIEPSEKIDSDHPGIIKLASSLARGEDDLFVVTYNLADWIKENVNYSLTTATLEANQDASWVLSNRYGVCDEITNLFIAMSRSLGIPAKFISGIAYTTSEKFSTPYGSHGWAEVYFPGHGWVPFDITYDEIGYVDPTHVKLIESIDSNQAATNYQWIGKHVDIQTRKLNIDASITKKEGNTPPPVKLNADVHEKLINFNSYNLVKVTVENLKPYYISTQLSLSKPPELEIIGNNKQRVLLKPKEKQEVYWKVKLTNLDPDYIYEFPLVIQSSRNQSTTTSFSVSRDKVILLSQEIDDIINQNKDETKKVYSKRVDLNCNIEQNQLKQNEIATATCLLKNIGNVFLEHISVCLIGDCKSLALGISQSAEMEFQVNTSTIGKQKIALIAKNSEISKSAYVEYDVLDEPKIEINELTYPSEVEFNEEFPISFILSKKSFSIPKEIQITLTQKGFKQKWEINQLANDQRLNINLNGRDLTSTQNTFLLEVNYNEDYSAKEEFTIQLKNPTFLQRMRLILNGVASFLAGLFT